MTKKLYNRLLILFVSIITLVLATSLVNINAAELRTPEVDSSDVTVNEVIKNPYVFGSSANITANVDGDVIIAGNQINVQNDEITGTINMFGTEAWLNSSSVSGSARIFATKATITGTFDSDLLIYAETVNLSNSTINGELIVFANTLNLDNTTVAGKFKYSLGNAGQDNLDRLGSGNVFNGGTELVVFDGGLSLEVDPLLVLSIAFLLKFWFIDVGILLGLIFLCVVLSRRGKLQSSEAAFSKAFGLDILTGGLIFLLSGLAIILISLLSLGTLLVYSLAIAFILFALMFLSASYTSIYIANLLKNAGLKWPFWVMVGLSWLVLILFYTIPLPGVLGVLTLIPLVFSLAAFGHILRVLWMRIWVK